MKRATLFLLHALAPLSLLLSLACSVRAAQELDPTTPDLWTATATWLTSGQGRMVMAFALYAIVAGLKLVPALRDGTSGAAKLATVVLAGIASGSIAWGGGASLAASATTAAQVAGVAVGTHESLKRIALAVLPELDGWPKLAAVVRALFVAPQSPAPAEVSP